MDEDQLLSIPSSSSKKNRSDSEDYLSEADNLSGIFSLSHHSMSPLSSDNNTTDRSKICRYCLSDNDFGDWLSPCKCVGTMKWVHMSCFKQWLFQAPGMKKYDCEICHYVYRRRWSLKPYSQWHWPHLHLRISDILQIYIDIVLTYRLCRYLPCCFNSGFAFFLYGSYALWWKLFVCKFCYAEGTGMKGWLRPCKCSGSMLWVHKKCFNLWMRKASTENRLQCQICKFKYRRVLFIKSWKDWSIPDLHLSVFQMVELMVDVYFVYRIKCGYTCYSTSILGKIFQTSYILHRFGFYTRTLSAIASTFFGVVIINAF
ncbi:unnamed protein product [Thelazia callipaeda]|uniref:RING-CH-type domain-containing protein n=1 Tax=Thelazia callipaeda TaxID=103827 RepID=A0A0N5CJW6_THECL|nr:unnamed protein product [Thelazia callipaeda]